MKLEKCPFCGKGFRKDEKRVKAELNFGRIVDAHKDCAEDAAFLREYATE